MLRSVCIQVFVDLQKKGLKRTVEEGVATILESIINTCEHVSYSVFVQIFDINENVHYVPDSGPRLGQK